MLKPLGRAAWILGLGSLLACGASRGYLTPAQLQELYTKRLGPDHGLVVPFAINEEVRSFFTKRVRGSDPTLRVQSILYAIFNLKSGLGLTYNNDHTLTANQTFEARQGNCLSFVNLFVGVARAFDIGTTFVEVEDYDTYRRDGAFVVNGTHIVGGYTHGGKLYTVDFLPSRPKRYRRFHSISDLHAVAHFYNNQAVELMLAQQLEEARGQLEQVARLTPDFAKAWNNLGVCFNRLGRRAEAEAAFRHALEVNPEFVLPHENLAAAYIRAGETGSARAEIEIAKRLRSRNPFFLLMQADRALSERRYQEAEELYRKAKSRDRSLADPYVGLGKIALVSGQAKEAEKLLLKALQLEADNPEAIELLQTLRQPTAGADSSNGVAEKIERLSS
jgi:tetratricopeptide (TPR) repeat protein